MQLTENGKALMLKAIDILESTDEIRLLAMMLQNKISTQLSIGLNADAVYLRVGKLIADLKLHHTSVKTNLVAGNSPILLDQTINGAVDGTFFFWRESA